MSRVIVVQFTSLDGVMHDPDGTDGSSRGGWMFSYGPELITGDMFRDLASAESSGPLARLTYTRHV